jgi:hypothetical protein
MSGSRRTGVDREAEITQDFSLFSITRIAFFRLPPTERISL